jgi:hypothetical protein
MDPDAARDERGRLLPGHNGNPAEQAARKALLQRVEEVIRLTAGAIRRAAGDFPPGTRAGGHDETSGPALSHGYAHACARTTG